MATAAATTAAQRIVGDATATMAGMATTGAGMIATVIAGADTVATAIATGGAATEAAWNAQSLEATRPGSRPAVVVRMEQKNSTIRRSKFGDSMPAFALACAAVKITHHTAVQDSVRMRSFAPILTLAFCLAGPSAHAENAPQPLTIGATYTLASKALRETRRINVYTPPGYDAADAPPLPVLVVLDGGIKEDFLHIAGLVQVSVGNGTMRPHLVVGIENTERRRDFTGPTTNAEDRKIAPRVGGSAAFRAFLRDELLPDLKAHYKTTDETAIVGESLAALFIVETLFEEPGLFDTYVAVDPSLWWNNEALLKRAPIWAKAQGRAKATLFLTASADGNMPLVAKLADALRGAPAFTVICEPIPNEKHATIFHPAALKAFRAVFKPN